MAEKVKQAQLPVTAPKKDNPPMLMSVQEVLKWALVAAGFVAVVVGISVVSVFANIPIPCSQTSKFFHCPDLTPAKDVEVESFTMGFLWFTVPQAAAATVGLLLPRRRARSRWSLAFLAIVSATVAHYMEARTVLVFIAANPGDIAYDILSGGGSVVLLLLDLLAILSLLVGGAE